MIHYSVRIGWVWRKCLFAIMRNATCEYDGKSKVLTMQFGFMAECKNLCVYNIEMCMISQQLNISTNLSLPENQFWWEFESGNGINGVMAVHVHLCMLAQKHSCWTSSFISCDAAVCVKFENALSGKIIRGLKFDGAAIQQQGKRLQNNFRNVCWAILSRSRPIRSPSFMLWDMCSILPMYYCNVLLHRHTNTHCVYSFASIELRHWRHHLITTTTRVEGNRCNLRSGVCVCSWICISCIHFTRVRTICMYRKKKRSTNE